MPAPPEVRSALASVLKRVTECWRSGRWQQIAEVLDPDIVMPFPDLDDEVVGRDAVIEILIATVRDTPVLEYSESEWRVDGTSDVAIARSHLDMIYKREGSRHRYSGWQVWVFQRQLAGWKAIWWTVQAPYDEPVKLTTRA